MLARSSDNSILTFHKQGWIDDIGLGCSRAAEVCIHILWIHWTSMETQNNSFPQKRGNMDAWCIAFGGVEVLTLVEIRRLYCFQMTISVWTAHPCFNTLLCTLTYGNQFAEKCSTLSSQPLSEGWLKFQVGSRESTGSKGKWQVALKSLYIKKVALFTNYEASSWKWAFLVYGNGNSLQLQVKELFSGCTLGLQKKKKLKFR